MSLLKNLLRWSFMVIIAVVSFWLFDLLLIFSMIILVKLPMWVWIVFGAGVLWLFFGVGIALCQSAVKWIIHRWPRTKISADTVKVIAILNAIAIVGFWWFGNDKFSFQSVVWRIIMSAIAILFTYMSVLICEDEIRELSFKGVE